MNYYAEMLAGQREWEIAARTRSTSTYSPAVKPRRARRAARTERPGSRSERGRPRLLSALLRGKRRYLAHRLHPVHSGQAAGRSGAC